MSACMRYKKYCMYMSKNEHESKNSFICRLWFVLKHIKSHAYDDLLYLSTLYVNIVKYGMEYHTDVMQKMHHFI